MSLEETMDYKPLLWSFPGSGEEELLLCVGEIGSRHDKLVVDGGSVGFGFQGRLRYNVSFS
jgi:hypothetical protein